jgi:hypothetical protein
MGLIVAIPGLQEPIYLLVFNTTDCISAETLQNVGSKLAPGARDTDGRGISVPGREGDVT